MIPGQEKIKPDQLMGMVEVGMVINPKVGREKE
jgi:hypothetical protein